MIPTFSSPVPVHSSPAAQAAQKTALPQAQTARTSVGESAAANIRPETTHSIDAPDQAVVAQRLRDQEAKDRADTVIEEFAGPEPTFEESPLERKARVALDPPAITTSVVQADETATSMKIDDPVNEQTGIAVQDPVFEDPPPTPTERAEASFAETLSLADTPEPASVDVAR